jgi:hypothetical protein
MWGMKFRVTDLRDGSQRELRLSLQTRDLPGWNQFASGWLIGAVGSGAPIQVDEPLGESRVGIFPASNHVVLWGTAGEFPEVWVMRLSDSMRRRTGPQAEALAPFQAERWTLVDRATLSSRMRVGEVYLRFDRRPLRLGNHIIEGDYVS